LEVKNVSEFNKHQNLLESLFKTDSLDHTQGFLFRRFGVEFCNWLFLTSISNDFEKGAAEGFSLSIENLDEDSIWFSNILFFIC
jgi:hypothetical protein